MGQEGSIFEGKTLDDAVRKGLETMGLSRAEVMIQMVEEGSSGFLGFGARPYRVRIMPRPGGAIQEPADRDRDRDRGGRREHSGRSGGRGGNRRGGRQGQGGRREEGVSAQRGGGRPESRRRNGESGPRDRNNRHRSERPERPDRPPRGERPERSAAPPRAEQEAPPGVPGEPIRADRGEGVERVERVDRVDRGERGERGERGDRGERGGRRRRRRRNGRSEPRERTGQEAVRATGAPRPAAVYAGGPGPSEVEDVNAHEESMAPAPQEHGAPALSPEELVAEGRRVTEELLKHMGFESTVSASAEQDRVNVQVEVREGEELLTGRRGEVRQALQHILNLMLNRGGRGFHLQLEINDFWQRRETELQDIARELAEQALSSGSEAVSEYLNAQERRILHVTLREDTRVKTYALGTGLIKRVAVAPADFPSQEESEG